MKTDGKRPACEVQKQRKKIQGFGEGKKEENGGGEQEPGEDARVRFGGWGFSLVGGEKGRHEHMGRSLLFPMVVSPAVRKEEGAGWEEEVGPSPTGLAWLDWFFQKKIL